MAVAYRPYPNAPGQYWADRLAGDWSYYIIASGFTSEDEFFAALASLTLTDATTFETVGANIGVVIPGVHNDLAGQVLGQLTLPDAAFIDAVTNEMPMSADTYGFELFQGATCAWYSD